MESQLDRNRPEVAEGLNRLSQRNLSPTLDYNFILNFARHIMGKRKKIAERVTTLMDKPEISGTLE